MIEISAKTHPDIITERLDECCAVCSLSEKRVPISTGVGRVQKYTPSRGIYIEEEYVTKLINRVV